MMTEYESLFALNLQQKLKMQIIGKIYVKITKNDEILVKIENENEGIEFKTFSGNFAERMRNGLSSDYAAYEILQQYRSYIQGIMEERFFYNK